MNITLDMMRQSLYTGAVCDALDAVGPSFLLDGLTNDYTLDDHPELKVFED